MQFRIYPSICVMIRKLHPCVAGPRLPTCVLRMIQLYLLLENDSSDLVNGDLGSSPMEPLTPFGGYVDRAVATSNTTTIYNPLVSTGSQELPISYPSFNLGGSKYIHLQPCSVKEGVRPGPSQPPTTMLAYKRFATNGRMGCHLCSAVPKLSTPVVTGSK